MRTGISGCGHAQRHWQMQTVDRFATGHGDVKAFRGRCDDPVALHRIRHQRSRLPLGGQEAGPLGEVVAQQEEIGVSGQIVSLRATAR